MLLVQLIALLSFLALCCFVPGFFFLHRLRWTPLEKLCASIGLSLALIYLAAWSIYCFGPRNQRIAYDAVAATVLLLGFLSRKPAAKFVGAFRIRQAFAGYGFLLLWTFVMLTMIRVYSGAGWYGDWIEHFQRSLFFLDRLPLHISILGRYGIPSRPPMMNVLASFFLGLTADRHELFQAIFAFLNLLIWFPCLLLLPALTRWRRRTLLPLVLLLSASPVVMENVTYTWTKALAAFYVVLGVSLYLAGLRKNSGTRIIAAFIALAAGILVHYSAGPYAAFLALHYLVQLRKRPHRWRELAFVTVSCSLLLGSWFGWSMALYGPRVTLTPDLQSQGHTLPKFAWNVYATIVPLRVRGDELPFLKNRNGAAEIRDEAFMVYQLNLIFAMGLLGGPFVVCLLIRNAIRNRGKPIPDWKFWRWLIPCCAALGIAVVAEKDLVGVSHLALLPLEIMGIAFLASRFPSLPRAARLLLIAGCVIDFSFGVFLHARVESLENTPSRTLFGDFQFTGGGRLVLVDPDPTAPTGSVRTNWSAKHRYADVQRYLRDMPRQYAHDVAFQQRWPEIEKTLRDIVGEDAHDWGGWFGRHGGVLSYLGDQVAGESGKGSDMAAAAFVVLFFGLVSVVVLKSQP
ncbi:MAG: hypothetical protein DMF60_21445 [Acidobacteria bacterium]|nr:MAG: hypothetical protein DMF60_21445 [Acidobacteriota bacterium]